MSVKNPHVIWASVVIIFILIGGSVSLTLAGKDVSVILTLAAIVALPVLTSLGIATYQKVQEVKDVSNGDRDKLLQMIRGLQATVTDLALKVQPPEPDKTEVPWKDDHPS